MVLLLQLIQSLILWELSLKVWTIRCWSWPVSTVYRTSESTSLQHIYCIMTFSTFLLLWPLILRVQFSGFRSCAEHLCAAQSAALWQWLVLRQQTPCYRYRTTTEYILYKIIQNSRAVPLSMDFAHIILDQSFWFPLQRIVFFILMNRDIFILPELIC